MPPGAANQEGRLETGVTQAHREWGLKNKTHEHQNWGEKYIKEMKGSASETGNKTQKNSNMNIKKVK